MFLDSGDGLVFRGAVGPWYSKEGEFHLSREAAREKDHREPEGEHAGPGNDWDLDTDAVGNEDRWVRVSYTRPVGR